MGRRTAVLLGALTVAVVLGVVAGLVVRLGGRVRDSATTEAPATFSATQTGFVAVSPSTSSASPTQQPALATATPTPSAPAPSSTLSVTDTSSPAPTSSLAPPPAQTLSPATTISVQATTRTVGGDPETPTETATEPTTASSTAVPAGPAAADSACTEFGARADPDGSATLYCQHDPQDGSLRWRAVVAGGGCLSKKMTGVDDAGVSYRCRAAGHGQNHWVATR